MGKFRSCSPAQLLKKNLLPGLLPSLLHSSLFQIFFATRRWPYADSPSPSTLFQALKEIQENLSTLENPSVDPGIVREQQDLQNQLREEMEIMRPDIENTKIVGQELMALCGEPDRYGRDMNRFHL